MAFVASFTGVPVARNTRSAVSSRPVGVRAVRQTRMSLAPLAQTVALKSSEAAQLLAAKDGDFGGYTGPIVGLLIIGIIIAVLTPAVKE